MKLKDIASKYGIDEEQFNHFLVTNNYEVKFGVSGLQVDDEKVETYVNDFICDGNPELKEARRLEEEKKQAENEAKEAELNEALQRIMLTPGDGFEGYVITRYSDYITCDDEARISRSTDSILNRYDSPISVTKALTGIRKNALRELKEAAYELGCNAIIGVSYNYLTLEPETATMTGGTLYEPYIVCVSANGTAVVIEKKD